MTPAAKGYIGLIISQGMLVILTSFLDCHFKDPLQFLVYLLLSLLGSGLKVSLPGINGTMSVNFLFILIAVSELGRGEAMLLGTVSVAAQYLWRTREKRQWVKLGFNVGSTAISIAICWAIHSWALHGGLKLEVPLVLALAACGYFVVNTGSVSIIVALTEKKSLTDVWKNCYFWSFPYYLLGAALVAVIHSLNAYLGWQTTLLVVPAVLVIFLSYRLYLGRLGAEKTKAEAERQHAEEMAALHLRTIEALSLAIEAKDQRTHDHLERVQLCAMEIGRELKLPPNELEALRAAAMLHDIGKLAVPEHIINKPGRLTPEEFEKMKIHPVVGAEILERVRFPYPVEPIVRAHHEKWDGSGYPYGLKGEEIPIGARILSAVDCLDAISSDRQYRRALPVDEAMAHVASESGKSFDPKVVEVLKRRYRELFAQARANQVQRQKLTTEPPVAHGDAPANGFEQARISKTKTQSDFLQSIASARQEVQTLFEMAQDLGNSLSLKETLPVLAARLNTIVPHDGIAVYLLRDQHLVPAFTTGTDAKLFGSLRIPLGEGVSGWVAQNRKPILNGNPSVEPGYLNNPEMFSVLRSALAVPLEGLNGVVGVLSLYRGERDAFTRENLRVLLSIHNRLGIALENGLRYQEAAETATIDYLTGLPNARSLFVQLHQLVMTSRVENMPLAVVVGDLDGFKEVNDRYGHLEGNRLLKEVAHRMRSECRPTDLLARMGGDEFVLVMPRTSREGAESAMWRFRDAVRRAAIEVTGHDMVSISLGCVSLEGDDWDAAQLLAEADQLMYHQKRLRHRERKVIPIAG